VRRALAELSAGGSAFECLLREGLERRMRILQVASSDRDANVVNRREYRAWGGEALADLAIDVLTLAEAACARGRPISRPPPQTLLVPFAVTIRNDEIA
jgi:hypothetical protein